MTNKTTTVQKSTARMETDYEAFVAELTCLTRKYGVAVKSVGGVFLANTADEFKQVTYISDITSGDLYPNFPEA